MPMRRRAARRTGRRAARRTGRRRPGARRPVAAPRGRRRRPLAAALAVGGTAAVAYKIGKNNAQKVEQYTGKSFDSLSEDELATAMDDLNIELPEEEEGQAVAETYADTPDYIDELERLAALKEQGVVSEAEFEAKKKELLGL